MRTSQIYALLKRRTFDGVTLEFFLPGNEQSTLFDIEEVEGELKSHLPEYRGYSVVHRTKVSAHVENLLCHTFLIFDIDKERLCAELHWTEREEME